MSLVLITMTGMRKEAFELCKRWMRSQTYKGQVRWIVVDDGMPRYSRFDMPKNWIVEHINPIPSWRAGQNTQARNLREGLRRAKEGDRIVIIEDDDYYSPEYLENVSKWLEKADLVGECNSRYYNVKNRNWMRCGNLKHCSLMSTAVKGKAIDTLRAVANTNVKFIDMELWAKFNGSKYISNTSLTVGIKGLPGRPGIGCGHNMTTKNQDIFGFALERWIGKDAEAYLNENT